LCAHWVGGASTYRFDCALAQTELYCASVAVRAEKRATKSDKLIVLFSETETAKQNQKFPFHFFFRFAAEGWGEEAREKCEEIFWFLHTRVRERVRGAHHWSSGFSSKCNRTLFNTHRQNSKSKFAQEMRSRRRRDTGAESPPNPEFKRVFHAPRGSSFANTIL